jgi:N,N'-diacetylchitobiose phosphorylase
MPEGLKIDPCIPSSWEGFEVTRRFRNKQLNIKVDNPEGVEKGVKTILLNGKAIEGNLAPFQLMNLENEVVVVMGTVVETDKY